MAANFYICCINLPIKLKAAPEIVPHAAPGVVLQAVLVLASRLHGLEPQSQWLPWTAPPPAHLPHVGVQRPQSAAGSRQDVDRQHDTK